MQEYDFRRDVNEQLAEALPALGEAAIKHAVDGLSALLKSVANPAHQKLLIWLWTLGHKQFGAVSQTKDQTGLLICLPDDGPDILVRSAGTEIAIRIDPVKSAAGGVAFTTRQIDLRPRAVAGEILSQLERRVQKAGRVGGEGTPGSKRDGNFGPSGSPPAS